MNSHSPSPVDADAARYVIEQKLGEGGAGAVYLAKDLETGEHVALKKLFRVDARSVLRLKREFRSLVGINHPHIVKLYDMGRASDGWFLTMEYLQGVDLSSYLAAGDDANSGASNDNALSRLLHCFTQLALGINALHQAGMLHRDLKPSNVLVVDDRVVVLDFGLVRELHLQGTTLTEDGSISGTPAYMAPEQISGLELNAASDWYAFGVMLYEALSGLLPFDGSMIEVLRRKLDGEPTTIHELTPSAPKPLLDVCMALLQREPAKRPDGQAVLAALQAHAPAALPHSIESTFQTETEHVGSSPLLFGRATEIDALWRAITAAGQGKTVVMHVRGTSGAGKSAVVEHFLDEVEDATEGSKRCDALVLRSRCYELEAMPFKALDGVIDALVRHLLHLDDVQVAHILPPDVGALAQLFPALDRLSAVKRLLSGTKPTRDASSDRQRAESALQALLAAVARRKTVVLWIDDLQWGDMDSARILQNWLQQASDTPILFVFSYRSEEITTSQCLARLLQRDAQSPRALEHTLDVTALDSGDIRALCERRLGNAAQQHSEVLDRIVVEAQGSPYLASQLAAVAEAKLARGDTDWRDLTLNALIEQTGTLLPQEAKTLLAVLSVAGMPMLPRLALRAAGVERNGRALAHQLRGLNLVRTRHVAGERMLEVYHDRVRESVQAALHPDERTRLHAQLFNALEFSGHADPDWLHVLALGAGLHEPALNYGRAAAERAFSSLAFERAVELFRSCIQLSGQSELGELWHRLAVALGNCGRGEQAAEACLEAAQRTDGNAALALTQTAATHLLRCGHFERGEQLVHQVLSAMRVSVPASDGRLIAAILWERTRLKLRGLKFQPNTVPAPAQLLALHDMYEDLSLATQAHSPVRSTLFQMRSLRCAFSAREPTRIVRSLCRAAITASLPGTEHAGRESDRLLARAEQVMQEYDLSDQASIAPAKALCAFMLGRHAVTLEYADLAERSLQTDAQLTSEGTYYSRHVVASVRTGELLFQGKFPQFLAVVDSTLREAYATNNRAVLLQLAFTQTVAEQIRDLPQLARPRLDKQRRELPAAGFGTLHMLHMIAVMYTAAATHEFSWAHAYLDADWGKFIPSLFNRGSWLAQLTRNAHIQLLINQCVIEGSTPQLLAQVRDDIRWLSKNSADSTAKRASARVAHLQGDVQRAIELYRETSNSIELDLGFSDAMRQRYAFGFLVGGAEGRELCQSAVTALHEQGFVNPLVAIHNGFPEFIGKEPP